MVGRHDVLDHLFLDPLPPKCSSDGEVRDTIKGFGYINANKVELSAVSPGMPDKKI